MYVPGTHFRKDALRPHYNYYYLTDNPDERPPMRDNHDEQQPFLQTTHFLETAFFETLTYTFLCQWTQD